MGNTIKIIREALESVFGEKPTETAEVIPTIIIQDAPVRFSTLERTPSPVQTNTTGYTTGYSAGYSTASSTNTSQGNRAGHTTAPTNTSQGYRAGHTTAPSTNTSQGIRAGHTTATSTNTSQGYRAGHTTAPSTNTSQGYRAGYTATNHSNGISADYSTQSPTNYWAGNTTTNAVGYSNTSRYSTGHVTGYSTATSSSSTTGHPVVAPSRFPKYNDYPTAYPTNGTRAPSSGQGIITTSSSTTSYSNATSPSGTRAPSSGQGIITTPSSTTVYSNATSPRDSTGHTSVYSQRTNSAGISTGYSTREAPSRYSAATETAYTTGRQTINSTTAQQPVERSSHSATFYATNHALITANDDDSDDEDTDGTSDDSEDDSEEENLVEFYHYTDFAGLCAIQSSGYIKESTEDTMYAQHGRGVYGTNMAPCEGKLAISINNWNNGGYARMRRGRADYAVCLLIPKSKVKDCSTRRRDLLLHKGRVFLNDYEYEIVCVEHE